MNIYSVKLLHIKFVVKIYYFTCVTENIGYSKKKMIFALARWLSWLEHYLLRERLWV